VELGKTKNATDLTAFTEIPLFCLYKCFLECCNPLLHLQSSEEVDLDHFCQCSLCFHGDERDGSIRASNLHSTLKRIILALVIVEETDTQRDCVTYLRRHTSREPEPGFEPQNVCPISVVCLP